MTVLELIAKLQTIADAGMGEAQVVLRGHEGPNVDDEPLRRVELCGAYAVPTVVLDTL